LLQLYRISTGEEQDPNFNQIFETKDEL
jgi:hypothetical protein